MPVTDVTTDPEALTMTLDGRLRRARRARCGTRSPTRASSSGSGARPDTPPPSPASTSPSGGRARYHMTSPKGEKHRAIWEFLDDRARPRSFDGARLLRRRGRATLEEHADVAHGVRLRAHRRRRRGSTSVTRFTSAEALEQVVGDGHDRGHDDGDRTSSTACSRACAPTPPARAPRPRSSTTRTCGSRGSSRARIDLVWRAHHEPELLRAVDARTRRLADVGVRGRPERRRSLPLRVGARRGRRGRGVRIRRRDPAVGRAAARRHHRAHDRHRLPVDAQRPEPDEEDGATLITLLIEYPDKETRDIVLATGMTDGMEASYARLEGVLAGV